MLGMALPEAHAQEGNYFTVRDFELWTGAQLTYEFNKDWSISLEHEYRFKDNARVMDQNFFDLDLKRNINKHFSLAFGARTIRNNDTEGNNQGMENFFRWNADLGYKTDIKRFTISSRFRYQSRKEFSSDGLATKGLRLKAGAEYNIKKWKFDPDFSTEIFRVLTYRKGLDKVRFTIGTSYKMKKYGKIKGFYRMERAFLSAYPSTTNILGVSYEYTFKK